MLIKSARKQHALSWRAARWSAGTFIGAAALVAALGGAAAPASAHNSEVGSSPKQGEVVTEQPGEFAVTTNDLLLNLAGTGSGSAMQVTGPADAPRFYGDGCTTVSEATVETQAELGAPGQYTVIWQTVSNDGHAISDEFTFDWQPAAGQVLAEGSASAPTCGTATSADAAGPAASTGSSDTATGDSSDNGAALTDAAWIGGAVGAVVLAAVATLLILRRRKPESPSSPIP